MAEQKKEEQKSAGDSNESEQVSKTEASKIYLYTSLY